MAGNSSKQNPDGSKHIIGQYRIERSIGRGGMGRVFYAIDTNLDRPVAIKVIHPHLANNPEIIERFRQEAKSAARLNHNGIVHVYEFGQNEKGTPYFVMEYVEGVSLKQFLRRRGSLHVREALRVTLSLVKALEYAHKQNVIHRDIKPANVLVTRDGTIKILDFGLARILTSENDDRAIIGSPHYMSPEQGQGEPTDHRSDIYSLGITLYHMLMGTVPYISKDPVEILQMHANNPLPEPESLKHISHGRIMELLKKMLAKKPGERFQNYPDLRKSIQKLLHGHISKKTSVAEKTTQNQPFELNTTEYRTTQTQQIRMAKNLYFDDDKTDETDLPGKTTSDVEETQVPVQEIQSEATAPEHPTDWQLEVDSDMTLAPDQAPHGVNSRSWVYTAIMIAIIALAGVGAVGFLYTLGNEDNPATVTVPSVANNTSTPTPAPTPTPTPEKIIPIEKTRQWIQTKANILKRINTMINGVGQPEAEQLAQAFMTFNMPDALDILEEIESQVQNIDHDETREHHLASINELRDLAQTLSYQMEHMTTRFKNPTAPVMINDPLTTGTIQISEVVDSGVVTQKQGVMEAVFWADLSPTVTLSLISAAYAPEPDEETRYQIRSTCDFYGIKMEKMLASIQQSEINAETYLPLKTPEPTPPPEENAFKEYKIRKAQQADFLTMVENIRAGYGEMNDDIALPLAAKILSLEFTEANDLIRKELGAKSALAQTDQERAYMSTLLALKQYLEKLINRKHQIVLQFRDRGQPLVLSLNEKSKPLVIRSASADSVTINNKERPWNALKIDGFSALARACFPEELGSTPTPITHTRFSKRPNEIQILEGLIIPHPDGDFYMVPE